MSNTTLNNNESQLAILVNQSNIEPTKGQVMMQLFIPYFTRMDEVERKISILPIDNPSKEDVAMAKAIRKALRDNRLEAEKIKKQGKETILIEGRLYDNLYNIIDNSSKPLEKRCEAIEKWHEIQEAARLEEVYQERKLLCDEIEADTVFTNIRAMSDEQFQTYIGQVKSANAARIEAERIEAERLAKIEKDLDDRMKTRLQFMAANDIDGALLQVREITDEQFESYCNRQLEAKKDAEAAKQRAIEAEAQRLEAAKKADAERAEMQKKIEAEKAKAAKQAAESAKVAEAARLEAEAARAELAKVEQSKQIEAAKLAEAALAPDKEKLQQLIREISAIEIPQLATNEAVKITTNVKTLLDKVVNYILQEANKL